MLITLIISYIIIGLVLSLILLPIVIEDFRGERHYVIAAEILIFLLWPLFILSQIFIFIKDDIINSK